MKRAVFNLFTVNFWRITEEIAEVLSEVDEEAVEGLVKEITTARKIFIVAVGRVKLSLQAFAKRLGHLGYQVYTVGDITEPAITSRDLLIVASGSGESIVPVAIAQKAKELRARIAWIGSNTESTIAKLADTVVRIPTNTKLHLEGEYKSEQPMTSLFEQALYVFGDALVQALIQDEGIEPNSIWKNHANLE